MGKNQKVAILLVLIMWLVTIVPSITMAADPPPPPVLSSLQLVSDSDRNVIVGGTNSINLRLLDQFGVSYSGSGNVTAILIHPNGVTTSFNLSKGSYSIANLILDTPGSYRIYAYDSTGSTNDDIINVLSAKVTSNGSLVINDSNPSHQVTATLTDSNDKILVRKTLTVDGSTVGGSKADYTTDFNGQIKFTMTPTLLGNVNFIYGGHIIGTQAVLPAYTVGGRIGEATSGNAALSVEVAKKGWTYATNVILTRDDVLVDAMTAVPLSKKMDAPILMTPSSSLDSEVLQEILHLMATNVYIIGGTVADSSNIKKTLADYGLNVIPLAGTDRYETAVKVAQYVGSKGTVYLAYGYGEPDAIAASAFAAEQGNPILLTERSSLPDVTLAELKALAPSHVNILGSPGVVSNDIEIQLKTQYVVQRWGGSNRYGTQQVIFQNLFTNQAPLYFASALVEPSDVSGRNPNGDALLTAALAAKTNGFVVAIPPDNLPSPLADFLLRNKGYIPTATVVGNRTSVTSNLEQYLQTLLNH